VLPCVDIFVADRFFIWAPIFRTRLALHLGAHLADTPFVALGHPTCRRADVPCVCVAEVRWGAQLADVPCVCVAKVRWGAQLADVPSVTLGCPTCRQALCSVWAHILRTCLALRWGGQPWWGHIKNSTSKPKFVLIHPPSRLLA
jgi:hypothetical protein